MKHAAGPVMLTLVRGVGDRLERPALAIKVLGRQRLIEELRARIRGRDELETTPLHHQRRIYSRLFSGQAAVSSSGRGALGPNLLPSSSSTPSRSCLAHHEHQAPPLGPLSDETDSKPWSTTL